MSTLATQEDKFRVTLRRRIKEAGLTQSEIAEVTGKSQAWVNSHFIAQPHKTLYNLALYQVDILLVLAKAMHVSVDWLLSESGVLERLSDNFEIAGISKHNLKTLQEDETPVRVYKYGTNNFMSVNILLDKSTFVDTSNLLVVDIEQRFLVQITMVAKLRLITRLIFDGNNQPKTNDITLVLDERGTVAVIRWGDNDRVVPISGEGASIILKNPQPLGVLARWEGTGSYF